MAGLDENGFTRKTLLEILDSLKERARVEFGADFNTEDDSTFTQLAGVFALELDEAWQGMEGAYSAYTLNGAEGVYLDDLFSRHNISRLNATAGSGTALIEWDKSTALPTNVVAGTSFRATNGVTYESLVEVLLDIDKTSAYTIENDNIQLGVNYTIYCEDDAGVVQSSGLLAAATEADRPALVAAIASFVDATNSDASLKTQTTEVSGNASFLLGYGEDFELDPLLNEIEFRTSPTMGKRYTKVDVKATTQGYTPLAAGGLTDMTPKFTGYSSVANASAFNSGTAVETDAEFRSRFNKLIDASDAGCDRLSIENAVLNIEGVSDVRIYENPTDTGPVNGAEAYTYHTVVVGGTDTEITDVLFSNGPVNVLTSGSTTITKVTSSGDNIDVKYTPAILDELSIRIQYTPLNNIPFTQVEMDSIKAAILDLTLDFGIGTSIYMLQIEAAVLSSLPYGRLTFADAQWKPQEDSPASYVSTDYIPSFSQFPIIADEEIEFLKV
ncbi:baseplate J/gp47 family protein [bacterium]|nr:baseplate J/gp47 family protein [bacterium]